MHEIDVGALLSHLGLDSVTLLSLAVDLEDWLGIDLPPMLAFDHPTLSDLSVAIAAEFAKQSDASPSAAPRLAPERRAPTADGRHIIYPSVSDAADEEAI
jgi:acyl carrier protein